MCSEKSIVEDPAVMCRQEMSNQLIGSRLQVGHVVFHPLRAGECPQAIAIDDGRRIGVWWDSYNPKTGCI